MISLDPLGLIWEDNNESNRPKTLWNRLTNGEKILVILDDVWGNINFDEIGIPHSDNLKQRMQTSCNHTISAGMRQNGMWNNNSTRALI